jgi:hypothetical protein
MEGLLMYKSKKSCVKIIQRLLNEFCLSTLEIDGKYGPLTDADVTAALEGETDNTTKIDEPMTAHFKLQDYYSNTFYSNGNKGYGVIKPPVEMYPYIQKSMDRLEKLREALGNREITIVSGYRSPEYNEELAKRSDGVAKNSSHMRGTATDIKVQGLSSKEVYKTADKLYSDGGVGLYDTFVHVDIDYENKRPARW